MQQKNTRRGFTLIELLVAVLIITLLAAVAVSQYKKAVLKSRFSALYPVAQSLAQGQESYYLNQGEYAEDLSALDVSIAGNPSGQTATLQNGMQVKLGVEENHIYVRADKGNNALMIYQNHSPNFAGETHCEAQQEDDLANWLCDKGLNGNFVGNKFGYNIYSLSEETVGTLGRTYYNRRYTTIEGGDICVGSNAGGCEFNTYQNYATCDARNNIACRGTIFKDHSQCISNGQNMCYVANFTNYSVCRAKQGSGYNSCWDGYYNNHSTCFADVTNGCNKGGGNPVFNKYSSCVGNKEYTCQNTQFTDHSVCFANASGACTGANYDETSCCQGDFCTEHQCATKPLTKNLTITQPVYEEMITPTR